MSSSRRPSSAARSGPPSAHSRRVSSSGPGRSLGTTGVQGSRRSGGGSWRYSRCSRRTASAPAHRQVAALGEARGDPVRLGRQLRLVDVLVAAGAVEEDGGHQAAAGHQADEEQPPLELGHQPGPVAVRHRRESTSNSGAPSAGPTRRQRTGTLPRHDRHHARPRSPSSSARCRSTGTASRTPSGSPISYLVLSGRRAGSARIPSWSGTGSSSSPSRR